MEQVFILMRSQRTAAGDWLVAAILVIASSISIFPSQGQSKIDSLEQVIRNAKEDTSLVNNLNTLSNAYMKTGNPDQSVHYADSALALAEKLKFTRGQADAHYFKGRLYIDKGDYLAALQSSQRSLVYAEESGDKNKIARAYSSIGSACYYMGDFPQALENSSVALKISEETANKKGIANSYQLLGLTYQALYQYEKAAKMAFAAIKIMEEIGDKYGMASQYTNLGALYESQGNYAEALKMHHAALALDKETGNKTGILFDYNNMGTNLGNQGNYPEALEMFHESLKVCEEIGDTVSIIDLMNNIGLTYIDLKKYSEAEAYLNSSLEIANRIAYYKKGLTDTHNYLGHLFRSQKKFAEAEKHFLAALEIFQNAGYIQGIAAQHRQLGELYLTSSDFQKARKILEISLATSQQLNTTKGIQVNYRYLYKLDSAEGHFAGALENYKHYTIYSDSLLSQETRQQIDRMKIEYETEKKDREIELLNKDNEIKSLLLSKQKAIRHGMIAGIILLFITGFLLFRSFRLRKKLEQQQAIISERKRISADLHDDVGSGLSRIMLLTELVKKEAKTPEMNKEAEKIASISKELSANISEIIWALNANNDYLESLVAYIRRYAAEFFDDSAVSLKISSTGTLTGIPISGELRREIFYTVKEALHNIYKHSQATEAKLGFSVKDNILTVSIHDNGIGMPEKETGRYGNGLTNMQQRMAAVRGRIRIENHEGTKITLEVPVR